MTLIASMGGCGSTSFISWFGKRIDCNCPYNSEGLARPGPGSNVKGLKHRISPPAGNDPWLPTEKTIERAVFLFDSPYDVVPSLFRREIAVGHAIAITGRRPGHGNSLEKFVQAETDSFGFESQFNNWTDPAAHVAYPRLIIRASEIWSHLKEVLEFLGIPLSHEAEFPSRSSRHSSFGGLTDFQQAGLKCIYSRLHDQIACQPQLSILEPMPKPRSILEAQKS